MLVLCLRNCDRLHAEILHELAMRARHFVLQLKSGHDLNSVMIVPCCVPVPSAHDRRRIILELLQDDTRLRLVRLVKQDRRFFTVLLLIRSRAT